MKEETYSEGKRGRKPKKAVESEIESVEEKSTEKPQPIQKKEKLYSPTQASIILGISGYDRVVLLKKYRGEKGTLKAWKNKFKK